VVTDKQAFFSLIGIYGDVSNISNVFSSYTCIASNKTMTLRGYLTREQAARPYVTISAPLSRARVATVLIRIQQLHTYVNIDNADINLLCNEYACPFEEKSHDHNSK